VRVAKWLRIAGISILASVIAAVVVLRVIRCTGADLCSLQQFRHEDGSNRVVGATFELPMNQGRGFMCPDAKSTSVEFWGIEIGLLDQEEVFAKAAVDLEAALGPRWREGATVLHDCIKVLTSPGSTSTTVDACGVTMQLPFGPEMMKEPTLWGVCSYPDGARMLGFVSGVSDYADRTFRVVRGGYAAIRPRAGGAAP
jgi:hypothetical protein